MSEVENELKTTKEELDSVREKASVLDKKYNKAKKLIKEFQQRYENVEIKV